MEKIITYQNTPVNYKVTGKGNPVVLLHGFGETGDIWDQQVALLRPQYLLIIPDLPGSGSSAIFQGPEKITMQDYAELIKAILDKENITTCCMIGHSMGGYILLAFAPPFPAS